MYNYEVILNYYLEKTPKPKKERLLWAISPRSYECCQQNISQLAVYRMH